MRLFPVLLLAGSFGCRVHFDDLRIDDAASRTDGRTSDTTSDGTSSASCGDGVATAPEECDDGAATAACSAACKLVDQGAGGTCTTPTTIVLAKTPTGHAARATGTTAGGTNTAQSSCTPANTLDASYALTLANAQTIDISLTPAGWDTALAVRDGALACNVSTTLCCVSLAASGAAEMSSCPVPAGTVHIVVDANAGNQSGPYTLVVRTP